MGYFVCIYGVNGFSFTLFLNFEGVIGISTKEMQINEQIRDREVRVITADGEQLGLMSAKEALKKAEEKNDNWRCHSSLERGNAGARFEGMDFKKI